MAASSPGDRIATQLGRLLQRSTRQHLYQRIVDGVEGVDVSLYPVLSGIDRMGPTTATRLAAVIGVDRSATTRYVTRLVEAGLVERSVDDSDARGTRLALTRAGCETVADMRRSLGAIVDEMLSTWPTSDAKVFAAALERFADELEALR
ncbi:hypothetical protein MMAD_28110 [Mycolicibacterium madagascariense]|uniref:HTH marR-type domain-containing protein n=1 Tax=Mycolicibacterium madagascariense TaxID=212765 RepID=A0A7I7XH48_9MYCO|nr:MarR family winged helix-turn-helix transcriptional regulator [Mycolicibacterium madagascariense]MCV7014391.1 winged helix-turn-helix transcriptional regulator [Mycolicibacterium madagascariense]BBZ28516.1 hypothetical protein MMAD_28110 [Mycolicibacterium madagascariense]